MGPDDVIDDVIMTSFWRNDVIVTSHQRHRKLQFDDISLTSYWTNDDKIKDVVVTGLAGVKSSCHQWSRGIRVTVNLDHQAITPLNITNKFSAYRARQIATFVHRACSCVPFLLCSGIKRLLHKNPLIFKDGRRLEWWKFPWSRKRETHLKVKLQMITKMQQCLHNPSAGCWELWTWCLLLNLLLFLQVLHCSFVLIGVCYTTRILLSTLILYLKQLLMLHTYQKLRHILNLAKQ